MFHFIILCSMFLVLESWYQAGLWTWGSWVVNNILVMILHLIQITWQAVKKLLHCVVALATQKDVLIPQRLHYNNVDLINELRLFVYLFSHSFIHKWRCNWAWHVISNNWLNLCFLMWLKQLSHHGTYLHPPFLLAGRQNLSIMGKYAKLPSSRLNSY